jgi:sRNA-binding protein
MTMPATNDLRRLRQIRATMRTYTGVWRYRSAAAATSGVHKNAGEWSRNTGLLYS